MSYAPTRRLIRMNDAMRDYGFTRSVFSIECRYGGRGIFVHNIIAYSLSGERTRRAPTKICPFPRTPARSRPYSVPARTTTNARADRHLSWPSLSNRPLPSNLSGLSLNESGRQEGEIRPRRLFDRRPTYVGSDAFARWSDCRSESGRVLNERDQKHYGDTNFVTH